MKSVSPLSRATLFTSVLSGEKEEWQRRQLEKDGKDDQAGDGLIVQPAHSGAAGKPRHTEDRVKHAERRAAFVRQHYAADYRLEQGILRSHANPPQDHSGQRE